MLLAHGDAAGAASWLPTLLATALPTAAYLHGVRRLHRDGRRWSPWRTASFLTGVALLGIALSPAAEAATDLTGHMVQHLLLGMYAPLALVLGAPLTLVLSAVPVRARRPVAGVLRSPVVRVVSHPASAALLSVGGLFVLHLTPLYALSARSETVHHLVHLHFLLAGCLLAWAVAGPDPAPHRPGTGVRVAVVVLAGGAHGFLAKLLFSRAPAWPPGSPHTAGEVEQGAQWMYYGGHLGDLLLLTALYAAWYRRVGRPTRGRAAGARQPVRRAVRAPGSSMSHR